MQYRLSIRDAQGANKTIVRSAQSVDEVVAAMRNEHSIVLSVQPIADKEISAQGFSIFAWIFPITQFDIEMGLRQISAMLHSGVTLLDTLQTVAQQARNVATARVWNKVRDGVLSGQRFADAMENSSKKFSNLVRRLVQVGEESGELDKTLDRAADHLESQRTLRTLVINALVYPVLAVLMVLGVSVFLVVVVIPKISAFLSASGATLPYMTQLLIDISDWVIRNGFVLILSTALSIATWFILRFLTWGREFEDVLLLRLPVVGKILRLSGTQVVSRCLEIMLSSGVSLLDALFVVTQLLPNKRFEKRLRQVHQDVLEGVSLAEALAKATEFLPMLSKMAAVGEKSGSLADAFGETARFHQTLLSIAVKRLSVLIEPVLIALVGGIVGFVYIAFFMAIFSMAGAS